MPVARQMEDGQVFVEISPLTMVIILRNRIRTANN